MIFLKIVKLKPYACGNCGPHQLLFMHLDCRVLAASGCPLLSCSRNMAKLRYGFTYIFLDNDLHFLENHSRLPGRRRNSPLTLRVGMHGGSSDAYRSHIYRCRRDHAGRGS
jgi:hypothetical protein